MATAYWMTFRIEEDSEHYVRHAQLMDVLREVCTGAVWSDAGAFVAFESRFFIDEMALMIKRAIDPTKDFAMISLIAIPAVRLVGKVNQETLARFFPRAQKL